MTPSQAAKSYGFTTLTKVSTAVGVHPDTMKNWYYAKPDLFRAVCLGVIEIKKEARKEEA